ncbi:MAG: hypothetical protein PHV18_15255 [Lachnospiraceae bacterium]|nr:hypothetical protein [Lachnospiraceae bacterium]
MAEIRDTKPMEQDRSQKYLENHNDVFADIVNNLVIGAPLIHPMELVPGPTETVYKIEGNTAFREQRRDVSKYWSRQNILVALLGLENQTEEDPDMGIRVLGYDYGSY